MAFENIQIEVFDEDVHDDDDTMGRATVSIFAQCSRGEKPCSLLILQIPTE